MLKQFKEFRHAPIATTWYLALFMGWVGGEDKALYLILVAVLYGIFLHFAEKEAEVKIYENFMKELTMKSVKTSAAIFSFAVLALRPVAPNYAFPIASLIAMGFVAYRDNVLIKAPPTPVDHDTSTTKEKASPKKKESKKQK
jgi:hypothetical protein